MSAVVESPEFIDRRPRLSPHAGRVIGR
jgi:hypothetical protein